MLPSLLTCSTLFAISLPATLSSASCIAAGIPPLPSFPCHEHKHSATPALSLSWSICDIQALRDARILEPVYATQVHARRPSSRGNGVSYRRSACSYSSRRIGRDFAPCSAALRSILWRTLVSAQLSLYILGCGWKLETLAFQHSSSGDALDRAQAGTMPGLAQCYPCSGRIHLGNAGHCCMSRTGHLIPLNWPQARINPLQFSTCS
jgi:hypothetical protein